MVGQVRRAKGANLLKSGDTIHISDVDIEIEFLGLRPGEKLFEELITEGEGIVRTPHEKIARPILSQPHLKYVFRSLFIVHRPL